MQTFGKFIPNSFRLVYKLNGNLIKIAAQIEATVCQLHVPALHNGITPPIPRTRCEYRPLAPYRK